MRAAILAGALVASAVIPASSSAAAPDTSTFTLVRTTSGASSFQLSVSASPANDGALIGEVDAYSRAGRVIRVDSGAIVGTNPSEQGLDVGNVHVRTCAYTSTCSPGALDVIFLGVSYSAANSADDVNTLFFVVHGSRIQTQFAGKGWKLQRVPLAFRVRGVQQDSAAAASFATRGAAITEGTSAPGGKMGSVAVAVPPCSTADIGLAARGVGRLTLTGGSKRPTYTCPSASAAILADHASAGTTWQLSGVAAGDSTLANEALLVIDTPSKVTAAH